MFCTECCAWPRWVERWLFACSTAGQRWCITAATLAHNECAGSFAAGVHHCCRLWEGRFYAAVITVFQYVMVALSCRV